MIPNLLGRFQIGQRPVIRAAIKDIVGGTGIATVVTFTIIDPAGVVTIYVEAGPEVTQISSNLWEFVMPIIVLDGEYHIECVSSAGLIAAQEGVIYVTRSEFS